MVDIFQTDTADYADYVLPAASFLEFDDLVSGYFNLSFSAQAKLQEPLGQSLPNQEIFRRLASAMGYGEPELHEDDAAIIARIMGQVGVAGSFDDFKRVGTVYPSPRPEIQFEGLASRRRAARSRSPLPAPRRTATRACRWPRPTPGRKLAAAPAHARLALADERFICQRPAHRGPPRRRDGDAASGDAAARGLAKGQRVRLSNETGSLELDLAVAETIPQGVALSPKGRWPRLEDGTGANVNVLNPGLKSDMGESTCVHGVEVEIAPA